MTIEISVFLYFYLAFILVWGFFSVVALYHMFKFGFRSVVTYLSMIVYIAISIFILMVSFYYIGHYDWDNEIVLIEENSSEGSNIWQ